MFESRTEAGRRLAARLMSFAAEKPVVYALPRGGVPVAAEVAAALGAPLDLIFVRKIGAPSQPELALGALVEGAESVVVWNEDIVRQAGVTKTDRETLAALARAEIGRRRAVLARSLQQISAKDRTAIVIDDGIATGATARAAVRALRKTGARRVILAVPVSPRETAERMRREADVFICLEAPADFSGVGGFYADFTQVPDDEVVRILRHFDQRPAGG